MNAVLEDTRPPAPTLAGKPPVLVAARDLTRRYGEGDTAVRCLARRLTRR